MRHRAILVGTGDIALSQHIPALCNSPRIELAAVCDIDRGKARAVGLAHRVPVYSEYRAALSQQDADIVVVCTPPQVSPEVTEAALRAGKDVLCEKPMAVDLQSARKVEHAERTTGRKVQIGFKNRFAPLVRTLAAWVRSGRFGGPLVLRSSVFDEEWNPTNREHFRRIMGFLEHGPPVVHDGAHDADLLLWLTRSHPTSVQAAGIHSRPEFPAPNYNAALIQFASGDQATLEVGWFYPHLYPGELTLMGPNGVAVLNRSERLLRFHDGDEEEEISMESDWNAACFSGQLDSFLDAVESDDVPVPGVREGYASLALVKAIERSMASKERITLPW